jgi:hypothetical protein
MVTPSGLLVLDNDELTLRCRSCDWMSPACTTVDEAEQAFAAHPARRGLAIPTGGTSAGVAPIGSSRGVDAACGMCNVPA